MYMDPIRMEQEYLFEQVITCADRLEAFAQKNTPAWDLAAAALIWALARIIAAHSRDEADFHDKFARGSVGVVTLLLERGLLPIGTQTR